MSDFWCILFFCSILGLAIWAIQKIAKESNSSDDDCIEKKGFAKSWEQFDDSRNPTNSQEYWEYPIVGMKYRRLSCFELESFRYGTLKHDKRNKHDDHAIGVYNEDNRCVGYIPVPENEEIYDAMQEAGIDEVDVIGSIEKSYGYDGFESWVGRVYIKVEDLNLPES